MSLVENLVNQISTKGLGGVTAPQGFDLNDDTFAKLLQQASDINTVEPNKNLQALGNIGQPSGFIIEPFDEVSKVQPIGQDVQNIIDTEPLKIQDVDIGSNYFSGLLKNSPNEHKSLMNVAQKHATNLYNVFGKNLIEDLADLAKDATSMM
ncbi:MAG: hypothetical protein MJ230_05730 [bacterium]|nr:hypothetical protein [bacterium]